MNAVASARMIADMQDLEASWSAARALLMQDETETQADDTALAVHADGRTAVAPFLPPLAVEGPGLFTLSDGNVRAFTRAVRPRFTADGMLVDQAGRKILGFSEREAAEPLAATARPHALRLPKGVSGAMRFEIAANGSIRIVAQAPNARGGSKEWSTSVGRLCLAIFPAPQKLIAGSRGLMRSSSAAGIAQYFLADSPNVGLVRQQPRSAPVAELSERLARIWSLSGRAEMDIAMATAIDGLSRTALNLVK